MQYKFWYLSILFIWKCSGTVTTDLYSQLAFDYFTTRNIQNIIMFLCWPVEERIKILKTFSNAGMRVSLPDGSHGNEVAMIKKLFHVDGFYLGGVFDTQCYRAGIPTYQKYTFFNASYKWIILDNGVFEKSVQYVETLPLTITTDMIITRTTVINNTSSIDLYDVYNPGFDRGQKLNVTNIGQWTPDSNITNEKWKKYLRIPKAVRRSNLNLMNIRAVTFTELRKPNVSLEKYLSNEHKSYEDSVFKMHYNMVLLLREIYNFSITLVMADNWSDKNVKGFYRSGNLLGILADKKADIMAAALQIMRDRLEITDVLQMTYPFRSGFVFRYSGDFGKLQLSFLAPFVESVWYIMLFVSIIIITVIWFILIFENKYLEPNSKITWSLSDTILSVLTSWCQMGSAVQPATIASRIVYMTLFVNSLILYNFYTSSIVSSLLSYRSRTFSILNLADSPLKCGSVDTGYVHNLLFDIPMYPNMPYFNSKKKTDDFYFPVQSGLQKVKEGGFAFHAEFSSMYHDIENTFEATQICELQEVDTIPLIILGIMGQKYSPYSDMFRVGLTKTRETGQLKRLLDKWVSRKPICQASKSVSEVNIHQLVSIFCILAIGQVIALLLLVYECKTWKKQTKTWKNIKK